MWSWRSYSRHSQRSCLIVQFTVDTLQVSLDTVGPIKPQIRCACGQKLNENGPACHAHSVQESTAMVGLADRPLDQSRTSRHLQESIRNMKLHRVLDGRFDTVSIVRYLGILGPF